MNHLKLIGPIISIVGATFFIMGLLLFLPIQLYIPFRLLAMVGVSTFVTGLLILGIAFRSKDKFSDKEELRKRIEYDQYKPKSTSRPSW